jgi:gamma-glutamyltranspeptidase
MCVRVRACVWWWWCCCCWCCCCCYVRLAFADTRQFVADPTKASVPVEALLSHSYGAERAKLIDPARATADVETGVENASFVSF